MVLSDHDELILRLIEFLKLTSLMLLKLVGLADLRCLFSDLFREGRIEGGEFVSKFYDSFFLFVFENSVSHNDDSNYERYYEYTGLDDHLL